MENLNISEESKPFQRKKTKHKTYNESKYICFDKELKEKNNNLKKYEFITRKNTFQNNNNINKILNDKSDETNTTTTNISCDIKNIKKVTFSTVEIVRIEKFKKFNATNNYSKTSIEQNMKDIEAEKNKKTFCSMF